MLFSIVFCAEAPLPCPAKPDHAEPCQAPPCPYIHGTATIAPKRPCLALPRRAMPRPAKPNRAFTIRGTATMRRSALALPRLAGPSLALPSRAVPSLYFLSHDITGVVRTVPVNGISVFPRSMLSL